MGLFSSNKERDEAARNTRNSWWNAGHAITRDNARSHGNEGLNARERKALDQENKRPWGQSFTASTIKARHAEAGKPEAKRGWWMR